MRLSYQRALLLLVSIVTCGYGSAEAVVRHVPSSYATIQSAIDVAIAGDTVFVEQASYSYGGPGNVAVDLRGKAITLKGDTAGLGVTINGDGFDRAFICQSGEGSATVIEGFNIINGQATGVEFGSDTFYVGGAILCAFNSSPTIRNCRFDRNLADNGGAIFCAFDANPRIENCSFIYNFAIDTSTISNVIGYGGAVYSFSASPLITGCVFDTNFATSDGAGLYCDSLSHVTVENSLFVRNQAGNGGGAIACYYGSATVSASDFIDNETSASWGVGSAVYLDNGGSISVDASIIAYNRASASVFCEPAASGLTVTCTDIYGNSAGDWTGCLDGLLGVSGNISANPLFCDTAADQYTLSNGSPCVPTGNTCNILLGAYPEGCGCCQIAGDVTGDGKMNLIDITFLIDRIFRGGAAPACCEASDVNVSGSFNLEDVVFLIDRVFRGGPAPSCGPPGC